MNKLSESIINAEKAIKLAENHLTKNKEVEEALSKAKSNYAYWVGYAYWVEEDEALKEETKRCLEGALKYLDEITPKAPDKDTIGFLKIVFGEDFEEVEEGRKLIREAFETA